MAAVAVALVFLVGGIIAGEERCKAFSKAEDHAQEAVQKSEGLKRQLQHVRDQLRDTFHQIHGLLATAGVHVEDDPASVQKGCGRLERK